MNENDFEYAAFISYKHAPLDKSWAKWLVQELETYKVPKILRDKGYPLKIGKIYRDEDEAHAGITLGDHISDALQKSRNLIVICSKDTQNSPWIDQEIAYFKSLGRGDRIFLLLVEGEPDESFPKSLLENESQNKNALTDAVANQLIAADVRSNKAIAEKDTKNTAIIRLISGIIGCRYDDLKQREAERQRKKRRFAQTAAVLLFAVGAISGFSYWDNTRIKTGYFAHIESKWGAPFGTGVIDKDTYQARSVAFQVRSQGGNTIEVIRKRSDALMLGVPEPYNRFKSVRWEVEYEQDGDVEKIRVFDRFDKLIRVDDYSISRSEKRGSINLSDDLGGTRNIKGLSDTGEEQKSTQITRHFLIFENNGQIKERYFQSNFREPKRNAKGFFGERYERNSNGLITSISAMDQSGKLAQSSVFGSIEEYLRNIDGLVTKRTFRNSLGRQALRSSGYSSAVYQLDIRGNVKTIRLFDLNNNPVVHSDGFHFGEYAYDENGFRNSKQYFGLKNEPVLRKQGYHHWTAKLDSYGNNIEARMFDTAGNLTRGKQGWAIWSGKYNQTGQRTEVRYYDEKGKPTLDKDGHHIYVMGYENGNPTEEYYFGTDGKPTFGRRDFATYASFKAKFDNQGRRIEEAFFGLNGQPVLFHDAYHRAT